MNYLLKDGNEVCSDVKKLLILSSKNDFILEDKSYSINDLVLGDNDWILSAKW